MSREFDCTCFVCCHVPCLRCYYALVGLKKHINDSLGHQYGDALLQDISKAMSRIDGISNSCYRMGGDEFEAVLILDSTARVGQFIRDFRAAIKDANAKSTAEYVLSASVGTCEVSGWGSLLECMNEADKIMYIEKKTKKHRG